MIAPRERSPWLDAGSQAGLVQFAIQHYLLFGRYETSLFVWRVQLQIGAVTCSVPMFHCARFEVAKKAVMSKRVVGARTSDSIELNDNWKVEIFGYRPPD